MHERGETCEDRTSDQYPYLASHMNLARVMRYGFVHVIGDKPFAICSGFQPFAPNHQKGR